MKVFDFTNGKRGDHNGWLAVLRPLEVLFRASDANTKEIHAKDRRSAFEKPLDAVTTH